MGKFIRQRKGSLSMAAAAVFAVVFLAVGFRSTRPTLATSGGSPYTVPVAVDDNPDPEIFETTIIAEEHTAVDVGNPQAIPATVLTYNGTVPGPEFRLKVGDTVIVHFTNNIAPCDRHPLARHRTRQRQRRHAAHAEHGAAVE